MATQDLYKNDTDGPMQRDSPQFLSLEVKCLFTVSLHIRADDHRTLCMTNSVVQDRISAAHAWICAHLLAESQRIARFLDRRIALLIASWAALVMLGGGLKILHLIKVHPNAATLTTIIPLIVPYGLIALAPVAGYALVVRCFANGTIAAQPRLRIAQVGRWNSVSPAEARQRQDFGMSGLLVSLVAGLLISMILRLGEYMLAMPAVPRAAPAWALAMFDAMTFDLIYLSFLYSVCIAMALRAAPLFPRMLAYTWLCDVLMQVAIAQHIMSAGGLPSDVAGPIQAFLIANVKKVLISVVIWLPYLLISSRVNVTFRQRVRRGDALTA